MIMDNTHEFPAGTMTVDGCQAALVDLFWALLNSNEFLFNH